VTWQTTFVPRIDLVRGDRIAFASGAVHSISKPLNDLMGLRDDDRYVDWLQHEWGELAPSRATVRKLLGPAKSGDAEASLCDDLAAIAGVATTPGGTLDVVRLAPLLAQVRRYPDAVEVPSLAVLAAWSLEREVERRTDVLVTCPSCERPWFARPYAQVDLAAALEVGMRPCARPAPGLTLTCAQLDASDRFARERSEWSKEYRKVMARKIRGTVSQAEFRAWKAVSKPGKRGEDWIPFDEWKEKQGWLDHRPAK
jgi:hypothetical protein